MPSKVKVSFYLNDIDVYLDEAGEDGGGTWTEDGLAFTVKDAVREVIQGEARVCGAYRQAADLDNLTVEVEDFKTPDPAFHVYEVAVRPSLTARIAIQVPPDVENHVVADRLESVLRNVCFDRQMNQTSDTVRIEWRDDAGRPNQVDIGIVEKTTEVPSNAQSVLWPDLGY